MKKYFLGVVVLFVLIVLLMVVIVDYLLMILYLNDFYLWIELINKYDLICDVEFEVEGKCFGGIVCIKIKLDECWVVLVGEGCNVLIVDVGD